MNITIQAAAGLLRDHDDIVILAHRKPDGDTLGSCFALLYALEAIGKTARVECADGYPEHYRVIYGDYAPKNFAARYVVACDVASVDLLGALATVYPEVDLCIDHHKSNTMFAAHSLVDGAAPAAAQILYRVIAELGVRPDKRIATALFTGLSTDTGCFRFSNVTPGTHILAAELIKCGADHYGINKQMFNSHSRGRVAVETLVLQTLEYAHDGRVAMVSLPADLLERFHSTEEDLDGISAIPRRIAGVLCGVTIRANREPEGSFRISMRCEPPLDASAICMQFGGGGHTGAAGCTMTGTLEDVRARLCAAAGEALAAAGFPINPEV